MCGGQSSGGYQQGQNLGGNPWMPRNGGYRAAVNPNMGGGSMAGGGGVGNPTYQTPYQTPLGNPQYDGSYNLQPNTWGSSPTVQGPDGKPINRVTGLPA